MLLEFTDTRYEEKRYTCGEGNEYLWVPYSCYPEGCTTPRSCGTLVPVGWELCQERPIELLSLAVQAHLNTQG